MDVSKMTHLTDLPLIGNSENTYLFSELSENSKIKALEEIKDNLNPWDYGGEIPTNCEIINGSIINGWLFSGEGCLVDVI